MRIMKTQGRCYLRGLKTDLESMAKHLQTEHLTDEAVQETCLVEVAAEDRAYWLFLDMPLTATLESLDAFLREIWFECADHTGVFMLEQDENERLELHMPISVLQTGQTIRHRYTGMYPTNAKITILGRMNRPAQPEPLRLMARNVMYMIKCSLCDSFADAYDDFNGIPDFLCADCCDVYQLTADGVIKNTPAMGKCVNCGAHDHYAFDPAKVKPVEQR